MRTRGRDDALQDSAVEDAGEDTRQDRAALGDEIVRLLRHIGAWKQRAPQERWRDRQLLALLVDTGPRRATDLAGATLLDLSTVSRQVTSLIEDGLVERRPDPHDRRGALLSATATGREAVRGYRAHRDTQLAQVLDGWPAEDRRAFVRLLGRFNDDFAAHHLRPRGAAGQGREAGAGPARADAGRQEPGAG